jgi:hypothetical protein
MQMTLSALEDLNSSKWEIICDWGEPFVGDVYDVRRLHHAAADDAAKEEKFAAAVALAEEK